MERLPAFDRPIAHRGLHNRAAGVIENSASAFEAAVERDFAIECDVQLAGDGKAVVFHDDDLTRLTGHDGQVRQISAGQLGRIPLLGSAARERPQRLEQLLEQVNGRALLVIEVKAQGDAAGCQELATIVARAVAGYPGRLVLESFDPDMLRALRRAKVNRHLGVVVESRPVPAEDDGTGFTQPYHLHMMHWPMTRFSFISCHVPALSLPMVRFWRARGMPVTTWTVRSQEEAERTTIGADQIVFEGFDPR